MTGPHPVVRPTRKVLDALDVSTPDVGTMLHELPHPVIRKAQRVPEEAAAGAAQRIRSLTDRVWLKVKTIDWRAAVGRLPRVIESIPQEWWIGAAGHRAADSAQHDFYERLATEAHARGPRSCSTDFLLPGPWDRKRLAAEAAYLAVEVTRKAVRQTAAQSLLHGDIRVLRLGDRDVRVRIRMHDGGEVYLAVGATGSVDVTFMTAILSAIPGIPADDWLPEPSDAVGLTPAPGEILWSALMSPDAQAQLLDAAEPD